MLQRKPMGYVNQSSGTSSTPPSSWSDPGQLLGGVELVPEDGQHVHTRHRLALEQGGDVVPTYLQADGVFEGESVGLVRCLLQHGGEAKKIAVAGLIDEDFLMVFVHRGHAHRPR